MKCGHRACGLRLQQNAIIPTECIVFCPGIPPLRPVSRDRMELNTEQLQKKTSFSRSRRPPVCGARCEQSERPRRDIGESEVAQHPNGARRFIHACNHRPCASKHHIRRQTEPQTKIQRPHPDPPRRRLSQTQSARPLPTTKRSGGCMVLQVLTSAPLRLTRSPKVNIHVQRHPRSSSSRRPTRQSGEFHSFRSRGECTKYADFNLSFLQEFHVGFAIILRGKA